MADAVVAAVVTAAATAAVAVESAASVPPPDEAAAIAAQQIEQGPGQRPQKPSSPAPVRNGKSATLTPGWDRTDKNSPQAGRMGAGPAHGQRRFAATFVLKGAQPQLYRRRPFLRSRPAPACRRSASSVAACRGIHHHAVA